MLTLVSAFSDTTLAQEPIWKVDQRRFDENDRHMSLKPVAVASDPRGADVKPRLCRLAWCREVRTGTYKDSFSTCPFYDDSSFDLATLMTIEHMESTS